MAFLGVGMHIGCLLSIFRAISDRIILAFKAAKFCHRSSVNAVMQILSGLENIEVSNFCAPYFPVELF